MLNLLIQPIKKYSIDAPEHLRTAFDCRWLAAGNIDYYAGLMNERLSA